MVNCAGCDMHAGAPNVVRCSGFVVDNLAPRDRAVVDIHACTIIPVRRQLTTCRRNAPKRRVVLEGSDTLSACRLLDDRVVPALANERDTASHHQLRVDFECAVAERDGPGGISNSRRIDCRLDRSCVLSGRPSWSDVGKCHTSSTCDSCGDKRCNTVD